MAKKKGGDGAEAFRLQPTVAVSAAPSLHQQPLPRSPWGGVVLPAVRFLLTAGKLGISSSLAVTAELLQHFVQCQACYLCAAAQLCSGWGWSIPCSPLTWGRLSSYTGGLVIMHGVPDGHQEGLSGHLAGFYKSWTTLLVIWFILR